MYSLNKFSTHQPKLEELANLFNDKLKHYFENVEVSVVDCPDLTKAPFNLPGKGLSSKKTTNKILDVGGEGFLLPLARLEKPAYDLVKLAKESGFTNQGHIVGAACGPFKSIGYNSELMPNVYYEGDKIINGTICSYLPERKNDQDPEYVVKKSPNTSFNILGNLYVSEGLEGKVLKVKASKRKNEDYKEIDLNGNLISVMRKILNEEYKTDTPVSMGGVFLYRGGRAKLHIMPEFSKVPLDSSEKVQDWLKFYDFDSPLLCLTSFHSHNNFNQALREEHTHCYGIEGNNVGGHYHYELDAKNANYEGYFNVAGEIVRVDKP